MGKTRQLIEHIIAYLKEHLPPRLSKENLPLPSGYEYGDLTTVSLTLLPRIGVDIYKYPQQQATVGPNGLLRQKRLGLVWIAVGASDKETTARLLHDYADIVAEVLNGDYQAGGLSLILQVTEVDFTPTAPWETKLLRTARLQLSLWTQHHRLH
ncbi:MAG: hypothetical protein NZ959_12400 [Armatimonadetes bacterium]|nr:hypothetical protein [Armatimonadota bacterium]MDW8122693.1 hypothetical protein [Armatimonadota bacterium]